MSEAPSSESYSPNTETYWFWHRFGEKDTRMHFRF